MERVIYNRLLPIVKISDELSKLQYGFRRAYSTVDAITMVVNLVKNTLSAMLALDARMCLTPKGVLVFLDISRVWLRITSYRVLFGTERMRSSK